MTTRAQAIETIVNATVEDLFEHDDSVAPLWLRREERTEELEELDSSDIEALYLETFDEEIEIED